MIAAARAQRHRPDRTTSTQWRAAGGRVASASILPGTTDGADPGEAHHQGMDRLIIAARLRSGAEVDAASLIAGGPPFALGSMPFERHSVHVAQGVVVFVFEGAHADWAVDDLVNDPIVAASFAAWAPLIEQQPSIARAVFEWHRAQPQAPVRVH
jgi:hypothetical protein